MASFLQNVSIKYRLMALTSLLIVFVTVVVGSVLYSKIRETVEESVQAELNQSTDAILKTVGTAAQVSVRNRLRAIAEKNLDILNEIYSEVKAGRLSDAEGRKTASRILLSQQIGDTGYIYTLTTSGVLDVHPAQGMQGRDVSDLWLGKTQIDMRHGYLEYDWANPGEETVRAKALYMVYFGPWDWIVSVSTYRDEFYSLIDIEDFRAGVESYRLGETGYAFIINTKGEIILHPWLRGNVKNLIDARGVSLFDEMIHQKDGQFSYLWTDPGGKEPREKIMLFRHIPAFDWIVASTTYVDEVYTPLKRFRDVLIGGCLLAILFSLPLAYYLGTTIAKPLKKLANSMSKEDKGDLSIQADINAPGEVGELAMHFNGYMERLQSFRDELRGEIDERTRAENQLRLFGMVFENALEGISITDAEGRIVAVNPAFTEITGYQENEVLGQNPRVLKSERHDGGFYADMWEALNEAGSWHGEIWNRRKNGESFPEILSISSVKDEHGEVINYVAVFHDISDMKLKDKQIEHQAYHDALTGLPNRTLALDRLGVALAHAKREEAQVGVLFLDLDNFKKINDSYGHAQGDVLIQEVARRLDRLFAEHGTVARLGGDEFLIIIEHVEGERQAVAHAESLLSLFDEPYVLKGNELLVTPSIGVSIYPDDADNAIALVKNADMAMYQSKDKGKNGYFFFTQDMEERVTRRLQMESDMLQAFKEKQFTVYFQPKVELATNTVVGMEALVRWHMPDGTVVSPADFIPLAEETGFIVPLGEFVLETSCKAMQVLDGIGCTDLTVSVNLSPIQFGQEDLVEMVLSNVERNGLSPERLELEITESTLMTDTDISIAKLNQFVEKGISVSIDDFGTGYSSLYYLKTFPIDVLKIDRSFVSDITEDASDAQIVETIILMARNLGIGVVAEGGETKEQVDLLRSFGCEQVQGYYYSRPLPLEDFIEYLKSDSVACTMKDI